MLMTGGLCVQTHSACVRCRSALIKGAASKSRALMFIALDKLANQKLKQVIIVVPERSIGASFYDEPLSKHGFFADWIVEPKWNLCGSPGTDGGKGDAVKKFL